MKNTQKTPVILTSFRLFLPHFPFCPSLSLLLILYAYLFLSLFLRVSLFYSQSHYLSSRKNNIFAPLKLAKPENVEYGNCFFLSIFLFALEIWIQSSCFRRLPHQIYSENILFEFCENETSLNEQWGAKQFHKIRLILNVFANRHSNIDIQMLCVSNTCM